MYLWRGSWRSGARSFTSQWMALTLATVLIDPHFYIQDVALVIPAGIALACEQEDLGRTIGAAALCAGWAVLALGLVPMREWRLNVFTVCMALGLIALVVDAARARRVRVPTAADAPAAPVRRAA